MEMRVVAAGLSDVGLQRDHNEDSFAVAAHLNFFVVADGMGGHQAGDVASRMTTEAMMGFFAAYSQEEVTWPFDYDHRLSEEENSLTTAVRLANRQIVELGSRSPELHGMGTTVVASLFSPRKRKMFVAHVGDSRAYRVRDGQLEQLTKDHSLVNDYLDAMPNMTDEQRSELPKNVITRALGMQEQVAVDISQFETQRGDIFLLCSDGLSGMVEDDQILELIISSHGDLMDGCRRLITAANENGGEDNITAVLIRVEDISADEIRATIPDRD